MHLAAVGTTIASRAYSEGETPRSGGEARGLQPRQAKHDTNEEGHGDLAFRFKDNDQATSQDAGTSIRRNFLALYAEKDILMR
jgi:hypothetical protein